MKPRNLIFTGSLLAGLAVAFGAFGAHALKPMLEASGRLDTYELAVRYQFYHAFALLTVGLLTQFLSDQFIRWSFRLFLTGTILFSGSLYLLCLTQVKTFAFITPIGGVVLIVGWAILALGVLRHK